MSGHPYTDRELEEMLIHRWPSVLRAAMAGGDDWTQGFARSIARHAKRRGWRPTPKQWALMRRLAAEIRIHADTPEDVFE